MFTIGPDNSGSPDSSDSDATITQSLYVRRCRKRRPQIRRAASGPLNNETLPRPDYLFPSLQRMPSQSFAGLNRIHQDANRPPGTSQSIASFNTSSAGSTISSSLGSSLSPNIGPQSPNVIYQQLLETISKRIAAIEYICAAHKGELHYLQTINLPREELLKLPYYRKDRLVRRTTALFHLGFSLHNVLDYNSHGLFEYIRTFAALMSDFESYTSNHPVESTSSLSKGRFPGFGRRVTHGASGARGRRGSAPHEIGMPIGSSSDPNELAPHSSAPLPTASNLSNSDPDLLPSEKYHHLTAPSLAFDLDFFVIWDDMSNTLIQCYSRLTDLLSSPSVVTPGVVEHFAKMDSRVKKLVLGGPIREMEDWARREVRGQIAGVAKMALAGLI